MKKILLLTTVLVFSGFARLYAQQEPQFTHYMFNKLVYNPASAGFDEGFVSITGLIHDQWTNFTSPEGELAPKTQTASIDATIPNVTIGNGMNIAGGLHFLNDKEAFITTTGFMLSSALHHIAAGSLPGDLSVGINLGMINKALAPNWKPRDINDPLLPGTTSDAAFDAGIGVMFKGLTSTGGQYYIGLSALHLPAANLNWSSAQGNSGYAVARNYFLTAGYDYEIKGSDFMLQPSVLVKNDGTVTSFGATCLAYYKQFVWAGVNVRSENITALAFMAGLQIKAGPNGELARIGYSYDIATSAPTAFGGTHEIFISYRFRLKFDDVIPVFDKTPRFL